MRARGSSGGAHWRATRSSRGRDDCRRSPKLVVRSSHCSYLFPRSVTELALRTRTGLSSRALLCRGRLRWVAEFLVNAPSSSGGATDTCMLTCFFFFRDSCRPSIKEGRVSAPSLAGPTSSNSISTAAPSLSLMPAHCACLRALKQDS